jgi:hypothetical protein
MIFDRQKKFRSKKEEKINKKKRENTPYSLSDRTPHILSMSHPQEHPPPDANVCSHHELPQNPSNLSLRNQNVCVPQPLAN